MKLWKDTYAKSTSHTWCTDYKIVVSNRRPLNQSPMPKPAAPHKWIFIDVVENPYTHITDRMQGTDTYMLTIIDIGAKYFWIITMENKTSATITKSLLSYKLQKGVQMDIMIAIGALFRRWPVKCLCTPDSQ